MRKLKKFSALFVAVLVLCFSMLTVYAENTQKLIDDADLLSDSEEESLIAYINEITQKVNWDITVYTNFNGIGEDDITKYSDDYFINNDCGFGETDDGVLMVIDMESRQVHFSTHGTAISYWTDERIEETYENVKDKLGNEEYYNAVSDFIYDSEKYFDDGIGEYITNQDGMRTDVEGSIIYEDGYPLDADGNKIFSSFGEKAGYFFSNYFIFILVIGIIIGVIVALIIKAVYKGHGKKNTYNFDANCSLDLTEKEDVLVDTNVIVTTIHDDDSDSGSGGGSSTHSSSNGSSFGGGGGGF